MVILGKSGVVSGIVVTNAQNWDVAISYRKFEVSLLDDRWRVLSRFKLLQNIWQIIDNCNNIMFCNNYCNDIILLYSSYQHK